MDRQGAQVSLTPEQFAREIIETIAREAFAQAQSNLLAMATDSRKAKSLRDDLKLQIINVGELTSEARIISDFYWAIYYHDGRGPIQARPGKFLVFYRNPDDDPRIGGAARNYPRRLAEVEPLRLSKAAFNQLLRAGKLVMTQRVKGAPAHPYFEVGFAALQARYGNKVEAIMSRCVTGLLAQEGLLDFEDEAIFEL